jgi:hypothetical protein
MHVDATHIFPREELRARLVVALAAGNYMHLAALRRQVECKI